MFCPYCGKQNKDTAVFCEFCGKALAQKTIPQPSAQPAAQSNLNSKKASTHKAGLSYNAKRGIVTGLLIFVLVLIVLLINNPPWNW
jgi:uncharacterized membrane protein YvbJ